MTKNSGLRKMTSIEAAVAAKTDIAQAKCKAERELETKEKYEAEISYTPRGIFYSST